MRYYSKVKTPQEPLMVECVHSLGVGGISKIFTISLRDFGYGRKNYRRWRSLNRNSPYGKQPYDSMDRELNPCPRITGWNRVIFQNWQIFSKDSTMTGYWLRGYCKRAELIPYPYDHSTPPEVATAIFDSVAVYNKMAEILEKFNKNNPHPGYDFHYPTRWKNHE